MNLYIVLIQYGEKLSGEVNCLISRIRSDYKITSIEVVRTDVPLGSNYICDVNECMEFSGYQEGLHRCISHIESASLDAVSYAKIIFINDTFLSSHSRSAAIYMLNKLMAVNVESGQNIICGELKKKPSFIFSEDEFSYYLPTWIFAIAADISALKKLRFYVRSECGENFSKAVWSSVSPIYSNAINQWLNPTSFFKGWYKSVPGYLLNDLELLRKRIAIYNEHMLLQRLLRIGFGVNDIRESMLCHQKIIFFAYSMLDRLFINWIKIKYRAKFHILKYFRGVAL